MSWPIIGICVWCIAACVIAMFPSKRKHWPAAYALMAVGLPLLIWVFLEEGWLPAVLFLTAAASILRWPVRFLWRWIRRHVTGANV